MSKEPVNTLNTKDLSKYKYLVFDGTYFHKKGCLIVLKDYLSRKVIANAYIDRENYEDVRNLLIKLKSYGLNPCAVTLDGHKQVIQAFRAVWVDLFIQRCLYHINRQGLQWLRTYPKTEAGKELRQIIKALISVKTEAEKNKALELYYLWLQKHRIFIKTLPPASVANKDLRKAMSLINNALPDMYYFFKDRNIASTTNLLENFFSQLKHNYRCHRGLTEKHKISYLKWYCYFKNTNTF